MTTNLLITPQQVIDMAFAQTETISPEAIRPAKITVAQEYYVRPALGDALYDRIVTGAQAAFVQEYLGPALAHYVRYGLIAELSIQIGDNGAMVYHSEVSKNESNNTQDVLSTTEQQYDRTSTDVSNSTISVNASGTNNRSTEQNSTITDKKLESESRTIHNTGNDTSTQGLESSIDTSTSDQQNTTLTLTPSLETRNQTDTQTKSVTQNDTQTGKVSKTLDEQHTGTLTNEDSKIVTDNGRVSDTSNENRSTIDTGNTELKIKDTDNRTQQSQTNGLAKSSVSRTVFTPSSDLQREVIMQRALFDANVLMSRAVRYLRANRAQFADYDPVVGSVGVGLGRLVL